MNEEDDIGDYCSVERCPNCDEHEMEGGKCYYCGYSEYDE